jgi:hypothetical protein
MDFVNRCGNLFAIGAILFVGSAVLFGVGQHATGQLLDVEAWLRAVSRFLGRL